jgi:hypothetical protein
VADSVPPTPDIICQIDTLQRRLHEFPVPNTDLQGPHVDLGVHAYTEDLESFVVTGSSLANGHIAVNRDPGSVGFDELIVIPPTLTGLDVGIDAGRAEVGSAQLHQLNM